MKIQDSTVQLSASHEATRSQTLAVTTEQGFRRLFNEMSADAMAQQQGARQRVEKLLQALVDAILAAIDGKKCEANIAACESLPVETTTAASQPEISWRRSITETVCESEKTTVCGNGQVTTTDGKRIDFNYSLAMERSFSSEKTTEESGSIKLRDPLMLSFDGKACELTSDCINFDLDADGTPEQIPGLGRGSAFLVFDRNGNGKADDGSELFGVASGNGFADLALLDGDHNGWIDEADAAFSQLGLWSAEGFNSLKGQGIGALYTAAVDAPFSLKTTSNELLGQIRAAGLYLSEAGKVGQMQQVDLAVSALPAGAKHPAESQQLAA
jgi:hypothetical protein